MKSFVVLCLAALAMAQSSPPSGCSSSSPSPFTITTVNVTNSKPSKRDLSRAVSVTRRQLNGVLTIKLDNGKMTDQAGRTGYIASNYQFQFDNPVQAGARETSGWSLCGNQSLALGGSTIFYSCQSGNFYNLYSQSTGAQCIPIHIQAQSASGSSQSQAASQITDGQPQASKPASAVTQITDGQPQASKPAPAVTQITDGQPQASKPAPAVSSKSAPAVTQITDGQPQASKPGPAVTQITDGQPQASKPGPAVTQITDGQPQASKPGPAVTQITDGQPQASSPLPAIPSGNLTRGNTTQPPAQVTANAGAYTATGAAGLCVGLLSFFLTFL